MEFFIIFSVYVLFFQLLDMKKNTLLMIHFNDIHSMHIPHVTDAAIIYCDINSVRVHRFMRPTRLMNDKKKPTEAIWCACLCVCVRESVCVCMCVNLCVEYEM